MANLDEIFDNIQNGEMTPEKMIDTLRGLSREDRSTLVERMFVDGVDFNEITRLLPEPVASVMHEGSGLEITVDAVDGSISINSGGNPYNGDPIVGDSIEYSPKDNAIFHTNGFVIAEGEKATNRVDNETRYDAPMSADAVNPDLTSSSKDVPKTNNSRDEVGISTITSEDGNLEVTIYDRGSISQGSVNVQYTNPDTGQITVLSADENRAAVTQINSDGQALRSGEIDMSGSYLDNDFRHEPQVVLEYNR